MYIKFRLFVIFSMALSCVADSHRSEYPEPLPLVRSNYEITLFNCLLGDTSPHLYLLAMPSFKPQFSVVLQQRGEEKELSENVSKVEGQGNKETWFLEVSSFKRHLRYSHSNSHKSYNVDLINDIDRQEIVVSDDFANLITEAWLAVLKKTRYPTVNRRQTHLDGTTFIFKCDHDSDVTTRYYGITDSSSNVVLIELGLLLKNLVNCEEQDRALVKNKCEELAARILSTRQHVEGDGTKELK